MISILLPTHKRPEWLRRMMNSATVTAHGEIEFVIYVDDDDDSYSREDDYLQDATIIRGPKIPISDMWNMCQEQATGPIYMQAADDILFTTDGWDVKVKQAFPEDGIAMVFANDGHPSRGDNHGTHPFVHKNWVDAVGYFLPPGYVADWSDQWLNDVARDIGRHIYLPDVWIEHLHPALGKAIYDKTYLEADVKRAKERPDELYFSKEEQEKRKTDAELLRKVMQ